MGLRRLSRQVSGQEEVSLVVNLSLSHVSQESVGCVMGYPVDLTVILNDISRATSDNFVSEQRTVGYRQARLIRPQG